MDMLLLVTNSCRQNTKASHGHDESNRLRVRAETNRKRCIIGRIPQLFPSAADFSVGGL